MSFDPQQAGFEWPTRTELTNPNGITITLHPYAANFAGISSAGGSRAEDSNRYYATDHGVFTELEIKTWYAGGAEACHDLLGAVNSLYDDQAVATLSFSQVVSELHGRRFADATILVNLSWLVQDGYAAIESGPAGLMLRRLRR